VFGINDLGHTCDEYLVLLAKSGMTVMLLMLLLHLYDPDQDAHLTS
jgi:hypothetical protein